jgi:hypothetical protein
MMATLVKKYGPEPSDEPEPAAQAADATPAIAEPAVSSFKARLTRFYAHYLPDKLSTVSSTVRSLKHLIFPIQ